MQIYVNWIFLCSASSFSGGQFWVLDCEGNGSLPWSDLLLLYCDCTVLLCHCRLDNYISSL